jgi:hypothetical protein
MELPGRLKETFERDNPPFLEKLNQPDQHLGRCAGIAQR